jgi:two-component system chemotaxis response regulator CheY
MRTQSEDSPAGRLGRVLIVDDEASVRKPIALSLQKAGYEVIEAENGEQAIETLNAGDNPLLVDTILCDIRMPKINGIDAITYFRSHYPSIPVVVLTGYPDVELAVSLMKAGVRDCLVKPVTKDDLLRIIRHAVEHHEIFKDQFVA